MKVYVVTRGAYSDYSICRIFSDKRKAERYAQGVEEVNDIEIYEWEKEFEDELLVISNGYKTGICILNINIAKFLDKYFPLKRGDMPIKVKIKCKNDCILIERIK